MEIEIAGELWIVYGTVIPYLNHGGKAHDDSIQQNVLEWSWLSKEFRDHRLVVAGDFNESLDSRVDRYHYGTVNGRTLLHQGLAEARLACLTDKVDIDSPLCKKASIDHICLDETTAKECHQVEKWSPVSEDGTEMSDHIGLYVDVFQPRP